MIEKYNYTCFFTSILAVSLNWAVPMAKANNEGPAVQWVGTLRNVHHGIDYSGHIDLRSLANVNHLYAVGPEEGLKGEITIWDSTPLLSEIEGGKLLVKKTFNRKACFLVYGQVSRWKPVESSDAISHQSSSKQIQALAKANGLNTEIPFAFLMKGKAKSVRFHVLNKTDELPPDGTTQQHEKAKVTFTLLDQPVEILGFYSEHHQGVFTHHDSFVHLHVKTPDGKQSGHVEALDLELGSTIFLPASF